MSATWIPNVFIILFQTYMMLTLDAQFQILMLLAIKRMGLYVKLACLTILGQMNGMLLNIKYATTQVLMIAMRLKVHILKHFGFT